MSDNEDDIVSKSDDTSGYNSLSLSTDSEKNEELNEFIDNNMEKNNLSQSNSILLLILETNSSIKNDCDTNPMLHRILLKMNASANSPEMSFCAGAYGSCKFNQIDDGTRIVPISYPHLY